EVGRREFEHRRAVVVPDVGEAVAALREGRVLVGADVVGDRPVAFVFAGVGEHYRGMAAGLHEREPAFRQAFDECRAVLDPALGVDLAEVVFGGGRAEGGDAFQALLGRTGTDEGELARTALAQPAVFAVEYALARLLMSWGVRPDAFLGYSVGEYVAACLSGVLALPDAARLVAERARLIEGVAPGGMLAVSLPADEAAALVGRGLDVAAVNGPGMSVLAGPVEEVGLAAALLESRGVACRRLTTSHAFHSRALAEVAEPLTRWVAANVEAGAPRIPYLSNVTGTWITAADVADPAYWARHMCHPVRFGDGAAALLAEPDRVLVEIGVGQSLGALLRGHPDCPAERFGSVVSTLPGRWDRTDDGAAVLTTLARLWLAGVAVDWAALHDGEDRRRVPLPTYPFQRESHWVDPPRHRESAATDDRPTAPARRSVREWLHVPVWRARELPAGGAVAGPCLVLADECGVADALAARLAGDGVEVTLVRRGDAFEAVPGDGYRIRPGEAEDHRRLLAALDTPPATVVHLWGVGETGSEEELRAGREPGFRSLCLLARALAENPAGQVRIAVVTDRVQAVGPDDRPEAGKAAVLGACLVLPQEYPMLRCRAVDVVPGDDRVADLLAEELRWTGTDNQVALRAGERLVWDAAPLSAPDGPADPVLRQGGVYLVTGGLGGVGLELADHLAATCAAKLVLTSRTGLPPRDTWDRHLTDEPDSATSGRIARVREVERRGGEVLVLAADVTDEARMREVVAATRDRFGGLDGVVHAAGVTDVAGFRPVSDLTDEQCAAHFGAKAGGALVLERVLRDEPVGFCVLMSSISAVLGGLGFAAYAAANLVLDALALAHRGPGRWLAVDWDTWESAAAKVRGGRLGAAMTENSLSAAEGVEAFRLALAAPGGRVVVSTGDLARRVERWVGLVGATASPTRAARPALARAYAPADGDHERRMAGLWRDLLGIDRIGVDDNFFDLGGHSLMGLQLINLVNAEFGTALTAVALFESPTVRALTARVAPEAPRAEPGEPEVLAERRHR
ncbi:SDR family NAD(P)-dependent oxidoreductase, partial [Actinosynnema sp. NPDC059797]